jgi:hypothetical protein
MAANASRGLWNVSIKVTTAVGPWAFSLHIFADNRAEAETVAVRYISDLLGRPTGMKVSRVLFESVFYQPNYPQVYQVKASSGDHLVR